MAEPLFRKIDSLQLPVPDLEAGLSFYRDALGHELVWRSDVGAGLRFPDGEDELVLQTERPQPETDLLVESVRASVERFVAAGGRLIAGPFEIQIGQCAVVADPFGNVLVMLDLSNGLLMTDAEGNATGNRPPTAD